MNQPGGVARITDIGIVASKTTANGGALSSSSAGTPLVRLSVKYIVSRQHEKNIEEQYVQPHEWEATLRDRSHNSGRCRRCGSLRKDCGFCDEQIHGIMTSDDYAILGPSLRQSVGVAAPELSTLGPDSSSDDDSDESTSLQSIMTQNRREFRRYLRLKQKSQQFYNNTDLPSSSSSPARGTNSIGTDPSNEAQSATKPNSRRRNGANRSVSFPNVACSSSGDDVTNSRPSRNQFSLSGEGDCPPPMHRPSPGSSCGRPKRLPRRSRRSSSNRKSVLEQSTLGSDDDSSTSEDDNIALAALPQQSIPGTRHLQARSSPVTLLSVSNPGSPDDTSDSKSARPNRRAVRSHRPTNSLPTSPGSPSESGDDSFIQPEGKADLLPSDIRDATADLEYDALIQFFDETIVRLERDHLPKAKLQFQELEQEWKNYHSMLNFNRQQRRDRREALQQRRYVHVSYNSTIAQCMRLNCFFSIHCHPASTPLQKWQAVSRSKAHFGQEWQGSMPERATKTGQSIVL
jgi:hypothetical protein